MGGSEIQIAAFLFAGLWCRWRHGKDWQLTEARQFLEGGVLCYYCPHCKGEVQQVMRRKKVDIERDVEPRHRLNGLIALIEKRV